MCGTTPRIFITSNDITVNVYNVTWRYICIPYTSTNTEKREAAKNTINTRKKKTAIWTGKYSTFTNKFFESVETYIWHKEK